ncbi:uncharacterized protein LOC128211285 isoform X2 [Mya arenaria]|uniref:uncharacterized protein LOC128211285 isoform X2 n=1 Tax=Mya arenaria TaxID=6604 RepID=UPI0022E4A171|nr:uncharacterized protein LOC128211285 isoform X2 [Mya arenaria]
MCVLDTTNGKELLKCPQSGIIASESDGVTCMKLVNTKIADENRSHDIQVTLYNLIEDVIIPWRPRGNRSFLKAARNCTRSINTCGSRYSISHPSGNCSIGV